MTSLRLSGNAGIDALLGEIGRFSDLRVAELGPSAPTQETAVTNDAGLAPGPGRTVDRAGRALARAGALASGANLQHQLLQQTGGDTSAASAAATRGAGLLDRALQQQILGLMQELGYDIKNLDAAGLQDAVNEVKSYAGLRPDGAVDLDLLMALFLAKTEQDRLGQGGGGGGPKGYASRAPSGGGGARPSGSSSGAGGQASSGQAGAGGNQNGVQLSRTREVDTANWQAGRGDVTPEQLVSIAQRSGHQLSPQRAREVAPHLNRAMAEANIDTPRKKSAFIAQLMHESGGFRYNEEIASGAAYEGRRDLGNTQPGDGRRFKGRGFIQLTGRANYEAAGRALGLDLVNNPQLAATDANAARVAAWYWNSRGLNQLAEQGNFDAVTRRINGGYNGKADRDRLYQSAMTVLRDNHGLPSTGQAEPPEAAGATGAAGASGPAGASGASGSPRVASVDATQGMTEAQKYDYYKDLIEQNGGTVSGEPNQQNIVGIRQENHRVNRYDDRMAVIWRDAQGNPRVREFDANMESISRYQGRYGNDVNGDGRRDLATLTAGTHSFAKDYSGQFGNILRPTSTTAVTRDTDGDGRGDTLDRTGAGRSILFHKGGRTDTGSAGCQTMDPATFDAFWQTLGNQRSFQYTVVDV